MEIALSTCKAFTELFGIFFNSVDKRFFVVNGNEVIFFYESSWLLEFLIDPVPRDCLKFACVSPNNSLFAFQNGQGEVNVLSVASKELKPVKSLKNKILKGFLLVSGRAVYCDLVVISNLTVDFFKITENPLKVSLVKSFSMMVSEFWFEPTEGVLVVKVLKNSEFIPFFLYQTKGSSKFQGYSFLTDPRFVDCGFFPGQISCNYLMYEHKPLDKVQVLLSKIYESIYLVCLEGLFGDLSLQKIDFEGFYSPAIKISLKPGGYSLRMTDNLVVLHNYGPQESYVFDIKREKDREKCIVLVKHRGNFNETCECFQVKYQSELDPHLIPIAEDLYLDKDFIKIFLLTLSPEVLLKDFPDPVEKVLFTLKRDKCLKIALEMLKESLDHNTDVQRLSDLFNITNFAYKETAVKRHQHKGDERTERNSVVKRNSRFAENQLKSTGGMIILLQFDVLNHVFKPFYKENKNFEYLAQVLITYISSLVRQELHVHACHQYLLTKTLIKIKQFKTLQNLFQYQMLGNDEHLAKLICKVENGNEKYPSIFNLGVDMLHRLKKYNDLAIILASKGDAFEALGILAVCKDQYQLSLLRDIILKYQDLEVKMLALEMIDAFEESEKKTNNE